MWQKYDFYMTWGNIFFYFLGEVRPHVCLAKIAGTLKLLCLKYSGLIDVV
ncbi:unknown [Bacteroides sp. CAG:598]|nr:unknown [Bacteroides sp. CAG:598]CCZ48642.1 unknown [Bacteroides sp. CAG:661]